MPQNKSLLAFVISAYVLSGTSALGQERTGLLVNGKIAVQNDSNVLRTIDSKSDSSLQISPDLKYFTNVGKHAFTINYKGEYSAYKDKTTLNYDDHDIFLLARLDHSLKINSEFKLSYKDEIEMPGINNSTTLLVDEFNQTNKKSVYGKLYYGRKESIGQWVVAAEHLANRYTNNEQEYRDVNRNKITATFFYRIAPKTRLLFQTSLADYDYVNSHIFTGPSSKEAFYLTGIEWEATEKTSGEFKIGYQTKDFDDTIFNDINGLSYILDMTWKPNTFTKVDLSASRMTSESSQLTTSAFITNTYSIKAEHEFTARMTVKAEYTYDNDDLVTSNNRTDERHNVLLSVEHSLLSWLNVSLDYRYIERSSDFALYEYKANTIGLTFTTQFK